VLEIVVILCVVQNTILRRETRSASENAVMKYQFTPLYIPLI